MDPISIENIIDQETHIHFVAGVADGKPFRVFKYLPFGWGPTFIVSNYVKQLAISLELKGIGNIKLHLYEFDQAQELRDEISKQSKSFQIIIGHSYGAALAFNIAQEFAAGIINELHLIDPVGSGRDNYLDCLKLKEIKLIMPPVAQISCLLVKKSLIYRSNLVATLGGAWKNNRRILNFLNQNKDKLQLSYTRKVSHGRFSELMKINGLEDAILNSAKLAD